MPPARLHLIVATRSDPPWSLATLRARGQMMDLRFPDLRFTEAESAMLLQKTFGNALHDDDIASLHDESEGWAAGLHLMTLVLHGQENGQPRLSHVPAVDKDIKGIGEYLLEEVLSKQTPSDQDRLLQMSVLGRFSASLCEVVCRVGAQLGAMGGAPDAWGKAFLARLHHANLFVIPRVGAATGQPP